MGTLDRLYLRDSPCVCFPASVVVRVRPMLPADEGRCYVAEQIKTCVVPGASTALGQEVVLSRCVCLCACDRVTPRVSSGLRL